jgi:hypothetical protein
VNLGLGSDTELVTVAVEKAPTPDNNLAGVVVETDLRGIDAVVREAADDTVPEVKVARTQFRCDDAEAIVAEGTPNAREAPSGIRTSWTLNTASSSGMLVAMLPRVLSFSPTKSMSLMYPPSP